MKTGLIVSFVMAFANILLGVGADYLIGFNISLPMELVGIAYLILWCWLNYKLYDSTKSVSESILYMSMPVIILFLIYIPLVRVLIINLPLLYVAPVFVIATSIIARILPVTVYTVVIVSILLMIIGAYIGTVMKKNKKDGMNVVE